MAQSNGKSPGSTGESEITTPGIAHPKTFWSPFVTAFLRSGPCYYSGILFGFLVEWTLNFFVLNHGPFNLLFNLLSFRRHKIIIPHPADDNYLSIVGQLDPRVNLYVDKSEASKADSTRADKVLFPFEDVGALPTADLCVMAAKLAYENRKFVRRVVKDEWKMNFVKFYDCWNQYQHMANTQAFIFTNKTTDANAVVVAFRGTEPFNSYDWSTDCDFKGIKLEGLGCVHTGFLEALGLVDRNNSESFSRLRDRAIKARQHSHRQNLWCRTKPHQKGRDEIEHTEAVSGLADKIIQNEYESLAYDEITHQVALLLHDNPKAKLFITGHSLGGALSALYATMLYYTGQTEVASKIGAVYTFGQPRVGDKAFAKYASKKLAGKYYRVVYCNDVVPRVPFDNQLFKYRHIGNCAYFNSVYDGFSIRKEPNRNFFDVAAMILMHLNALWEVFQALIFITREHGDEYSESCMCLLFRALGLLLPGISSHSLCNYVNAVRLGPLPRREPEEDKSTDFHFMQENVKGVLSAIHKYIGRHLGLK